MERNPMVYIKFGNCYTIGQIKMTAKYSGYTVFLHDILISYLFTKCCNSTHYAKNDSSIITSPLTYAYVCIKITVQFLIEMEFHTLGSSYMVNFYNLHL